jgi:hypothetical protein
MQAKMVKTKPTRVLLGSYNSTFNMKASCSSTASITFQKHAQIASGVTPRIKVRKNWSGHSKPNYSQPGIIERPQNALVRLCYKYSKRVDEVSCE